MQDYDKFDKMINANGLSGSDEFAEFEGMFEVTQALKSNIKLPRAAAENASRMKMLAEAEAVQTEVRDRRGRRLGALFAWAVPAVLLLAIAGVILGNRSPTEPAVAVPGAAPQEEPGVLATTVPTPTQSIQEVDPISTQLPAELQGTAVLTGTRGSDGAVVLPLEDGTELELPQPNLPLPGGAGSPIDKEGGVIDPEQSQNGESPDQ